MRSENPGEPLHICHLTVLNPARHSRIYEKEAISQAEAGFRVTVIGQESPQKESGPSTDSSDKSAPQVTIRTFPAFNRLSLKRWQIRKTLFKLALEVQADVYQIHTPELLAVGKKLKDAVKGCRVVYDMHEDYYLNLRYGGYISALIRAPLANWVRKQEKKAGKWLDGVFYAELCFQSILSLPYASITVENKFKAPPGWTHSSENKQSKVPRMVFTGTIAENWGILQALDLVKRLNDHTPVEFEIVGQLHDEALGQKIHRFIKENGLSERVVCSFSEKYRPHSELLNTMQNGHTGTALYVLRENLKDRIPTKFYEHMAVGRPILFTDNPSWNALNDRLGFGIAVRFPLEEGQVQRITAHLQGKWESNSIDPEEWSWQSEEKKMIDFLRKWERSRDDG